MAEVDKDEGFLRQLMDTFKMEADDHLKNVALLLVTLEKSETPFEAMDDIETIFREIHSLKGAARAVNLKRVESLCQVMENVLSLLKKKQLDFYPETFDVFQDSMDHLSKSIQNAGNDPILEETSFEKDLISRFEKLKEQPARDIPQVVSVANQQINLVKHQDNQDQVTSFGIDTGTQRISSARLLSILLQSEEMLTLKLTSYEQITKMRMIVSTFAEWKKKHSQILPVENAMHNMLLNNKENGKDLVLRGHSKRLLEFIEWNNHFVKHLDDALNEVEKSAKYNDLRLRGMIDSLQEELKKVAMCPFSSILEVIPKMVRDISAKIGQKIDLEIIGSEIEIDRRILEEMHDPIIHLIRNCIDHGIESPEERKKKNKNPVGEIRIGIVPRGQMVELTVSDDGRGISTDALRESLKKDTVFSKIRTEQYTLEEMQSTVFLSGISTSPIITETSGRGLGLAIVKEKVEKMGGTIELWSEKDKGTRFQIQLPLSIATFRGILILIGDQKFIIPTRYVKRVLRIKKEDLRTIENREIIYLNEKSISMVKLEEVLKIKSKHSPLSHYLKVIIISVEGLCIAFQVDEVLNEQEVLFKNLGPLLVKVKNFVGATVLGSGEVVAILNVIDLLDSSINHLYNSLEMGNELGNQRADDEELQMAPAILIAEDSITTRTLLKNILESSGYIVETAIDGIDASNKLKETHFDLVLSDVEMPKMNGFELTSQIRSQSETKNLPIILITALASKEDRERGIDVGANAYIIKESFDQKNLLDVIKRLAPRRDTP